MGSTPPNSPGASTLKDSKSAPNLAVGPGQPPARRKKTRFFWLIAAMLVLVAASVLAYLHFAPWESTDDAQIDGYIYPVSSRVGGYVTRVTVDENQYVPAGTVLVQLDPKDYEVALANAKASLANEEASAAALETGVPLVSINTSSQLSSAEADIENFNSAVIAAQRQHDGAEASLRQAEANDLKAQDDVTRYKPLAAKDEIPQQQYTQAVDAQKATAAAVEAARQAAAAAEQEVAQARARLSQSQAQLRYAQTRPQQISVQRSRVLAARADIDRSEAQLEQAELNMQYTTIVAPVNGVVGQRSVQPGQNVAPGQQMMTIVPLDTQNIWVTADFKETQLKYMRPGQPVKVKVDSYGRTYDAHVLNIAAASGARFSLLPPENATGNYVKVVQRIPVKIVFEKGQDPEHLLRPGMSVEPDVKVR
jgi:membrane fusion protein (multidrug efflux system)